MRRAAGFGADKGRPLRLHHADRSVRGELRYVCVGQALVEHKHIQCCSCCAALCGVWGNHAADVNEACQVLLIASVVVFALLHDDITDLFSADHEDDPDTVSPPTPQSTSHAHSYHLPFTPPERTIHLPRLFIRSTS